MANDLRWDIQGLEELNARFQYLGFDMRYKGGRFALRKAANIVRDQVKQNAMALDDPNTGRVIADNVAIRWGGKHFKQIGELMFRIGVLGSNKISGNSNPDTGSGGATPHWHLLEFGTSKMAAQPFVRPAIEAKIQAIPAEFVKHYERAMMRALRRVRRRR